MCSACAGIEAGFEPAEIVVKVVVKIFLKIGCQERVTIESPSVSIFGIFSVVLAHDVNKRTQYLIFNVLV